MRLEPFWSNHNDETLIDIYHADAISGLKALPEESVHCCVTSPPYYGLRSYLPEEHESKSMEIGIEESPEEYIQRMVEVCREVRRVLRKDGTLWVVIGDSYAGSGKGPNGKTGLINHEERMGFHSPGAKTPYKMKPKDLMGIPWWLAVALRQDGWYLRKDIIWHKEDPTPESVRDRPTSAHEYVFLLSKSSRYYYDREAIREPVKPGTDGRVVAPSKHESNKDSETGYVQREIQYEEIKGANRRSVWTIATGNYSGAHFATFPVELVSLCIKAGTSEKGCCPKCGAPWTRIVKVEGASSAEIMKGRDKSHFMSEQGQVQNLRAGESAFNRPRASLGWQAGCDCNCSPIPCTVLDPFLGAGTTLLVAQRLARSGIGIELFAKFCGMSVQRIGEEHLQLRLSDYDIDEMIEELVEAKNKKHEQLSFQWE